MERVQIVALDAAGKCPVCDGGLKRMKFKLIDNNGDTATTRDGWEMVYRFTERGNFVTNQAAVEYFTAMKIGAIWTTGVSAYERIE